MYSRFSYTALYKQTHSLLLYYNNMQMCKIPLFTGIVYYCCYGYVPTWVAETAVV